MRYGLLKTIALALTIALVGACARFEDRPLTAAHNKSQIEARSLHDPALLQFVDHMLGVDPLRPGELTRKWDLDRLTLAAVYLHPDLQVVRAQAAGADAATITAAQRPNPSLTLTPTWVRNLAGTAVPLVAASVFSIPLETAGKRDYRMDRAAQSATAARWRVVDTAWQLRGRLRQALLEVHAAQEIARVQQRELTIQRELTQRLEQQRLVGEIAQFDVSRARLILNQTELLLSSTHKREAESHSALAAALGLRVTALAGIDPDLSDMAVATELPTLAITTLRDTALRERPDVQAALADYAASQSALQLEVANQYPNVQLNPGYMWELGEHRWSLGAMLPLPLLHQNQGAIAEAEARRCEMAARFDALQTRILGDIDRVALGLNAVRDKGALVQRQLATAHDNLRTIQALFHAGEADRLGVLSAELEVRVSERARLDVLIETQQAVNALEDALRTPIASLPRSVDLNAAVSQLHERER
jgi:outer membrane protein, heavy metal efflux system